MQLKIKVNYDHISESFYVAMCPNGDLSPHFYFDHTIAIMLKINLDNYRDILKTKFNGNVCIHSDNASMIDTTKFNNKHDAQNAADWIKSQYLLSVLSKT